MSEVAYLIGAGASAGCIPVVNNMETAIETLLKDVQPLTAKYHNSIYGDERMKFVAQADYCKGVLKKLQMVCKEYFSIDTYAKKLYLTDKIEFEILKKELCFYFTLMQIVRPRDKRYDNFFASVINELGKLPPRIKIISWNYDYQLELSHTQFTEEKKLNISRGLLNMVSPDNYQDFNNVLNQFSVIKLNGSASFRDGNSTRYLCENLSTRVEDNVVQLYTEFHGLMNGQESIDTDLKFAWESKEFKSMVQIYGKELRKVQTLVVIGYSFPYFNRTIDMALLSEMKNLKKIYIQDLVPGNIKEIMVEFVDGKTGSHNEIEYIGKTNLSQFVFPKELDVSGPAGHAVEDVE